MSQNITPENTHTLDFLMKGDYPAVIADKIIEGEFNITDKNFLCKGLKFENCEFSKLLVFSKVDLRSGVRFINCTFRGRVLFGQIKAGEMEDHFNGDNANIYFENCRILKEVRLIADTIGRSVKFKDCTEIERVAVDRSVIHDLNLENCTVNHLDIQHMDSSMGMRIEKCTVTGQGRYSGCTGDGFTFMNSNFARDQSVWGGKIRSVTTNNGTFEDDFKIQAVTASDGYSLFGTVFKKAVSIPLEDTASNIKATINSCFIENCDFQGGFEFKGANATAGAPSCTKLTVKCSALSKGNMSFDAADIVETIFSGTNTSANISFRKCKLKQVRIDYFTNLGKLYFADLLSFDPKDAIFSVNKTALGTTIFLNVDFAGYPSVIIKHSHLTDILFTDVKWFNPQQLNPYETFEDLINPDNSVKFKKKGDRKAWSLAKTNREVYRQLKYAATKQGDSVQALIFQGEEMTQFNRELECYAFQWHMIGNKSMMAMNRSNDYGNNWVKPVLLLLSVNLVFFFLITIAQSDQFNWPIAKNGDDFSQTFDLLWKNNGAYWGILNPVRRLSDVYDNKGPYNGTTIFWDYFDRIVLAYFLFQIVSAFRKYSK